MTALVGDGIADDTNALQGLIDAAQGGRVELPAGRFKITRELTRTANGGEAPGVQLIGRHPSATTIMAAYDGNPNLGAMLRLDTAGISNYTHHSRIENLSLEQAAGATGINGIQLTACWFVNIKNVKVYGLSAHGLIATLRPDIHPTISDYYQAFAVNVEDSYFRGMNGRGVSFAAGQSPGLYKIERCMIYGNRSGGILSTTGQCQIVGNSIAENGIDGGGGILFDTMEGPSMVPDLRQNEFDCNFLWNLRFRRVLDGQVKMNRFLSCTTNGANSFTRVPGGSFMRPPVDVICGEPGVEFSRMVFEQNLHRSVTGGVDASGHQIVTTAPKVMYQANGATLRGNRFLYNDIDGADGVTQNSANTTKSCWSSPVGRSSGATCNARAARSWGVP